MNKLLRLLPALMALALLSACATPAAPNISTDPPPEPWETAQRFLSFASAQSLPQEKQDAIQATLSEASDGQLYCNFYPSSQMGDDEALMEAVHSGAISVVRASTSAQVKLIPQLALLDIPHLFSDPETCNRLLKGDLMDFFQPYFNASGLQLLSWRCSAFRQLTTSIPVDTPQDLARLKIRTLDNPYHQLYWSSLGAEPQYVEFSNLFYAIQQGLVNAQENTVGSAVGTGLHELHPYLVLTSHVPFINAVVMNKASYDALPPAEQEAVMEAFSLQPSAAAANDHYDRFAQVITPDAALQAALDAGADTVRAALEADLGAETLQQFEAIVQPLDTVPPQKQQPLVSG